MTCPRDEWILTTLKRLFLDSRLRLVMPEDACFSHTPQSLANTTSLWTVSRTLGAMRNFASVSSPIRKPSYDLGEATGFPRYGYLWIQLALVLDGFCRNNYLTQSALRYPTPVEFAQQWREQNDPIISWEMNP